MGLRWQAMCVDAHDPGRIATFWEAALGWRRTYDSPDEVVLGPPAGSAEDGVSPDLLFLRVPCSPTRTATSSACCASSHPKSSPLPERAYR